MARAGPWFRWPTLSLPHASVAIVDDGLESPNNRRILPWGQTDTGGRQPLFTKCLCVSRGSGQVHAICSSFSVGRSQVYNETISWDGRSLGIAPRAV